MFFKYAFDQKIEKNIKHGQISAFFFSFKMVCSGGSARSQFIKSIHGGTGLCPHEYLNHMSDSSKLRLQCDPEQTAPARVDCLYMEGGGGARERK